ncbi:MAG: hypothetical protein IJI54_03140 [Kiritimatiellae bacterium]|nr:hypothetical protein [Kiritimatiellia bacterium]
MRRAQAMLETLIALLVIMLAFTGAHLLSRKLEAKTILNHAAARAARARAVGFNEFMCRKTARAAMIPISGRRLWPDEDGVDEVSRVPIYLSAEDEGRANAVLDYENWHSSAIRIDSPAGIAPLVDVDIYMSSDDFDMTGGASVESHFPLYMYNQGR